MLRYPKNRYTSQSIGIKSRINYFRADPFLPLHKGPGLEKEKKSVLQSILRNFKNRKRFSTYLMTTFVIIVTLSVVIILGVLQLYLGRRVESEFYKKLLAQKRQVEIILKTRLTSVERVLGDLQNDNIIRVTAMLKAKSQLQKRLVEVYPPKEGVFFFIKKVGQTDIIPENYPALSKEWIKYAIKRYPIGEVVGEGTDTKLLWLFSAAIMQSYQRMGTAYALYDMMQDHKLIADIRRNVEGDISVIKSDRLLSLESGTALSYDEKRIKPSQINSEFQHFGQNLLIGKLEGFANLYFQSSLESLRKEKRKLTIWMGLFSIIVLAISTALSVWLGKKMIRPLGQMTQKAIQISEGQKDLQFDIDNKNYWEFNQLSQAFNYMLINLKDAEEQSRYKELLENVDDAVYILDRSGNIMEANEAAYTQLGYTPEAFFNLNITDILPVNDAPAILQQLADGLEDQLPENVNVETHHIKKDGDVIPVEIHSRAIVYRSKNVILNVARDISERIEAENEKKRLEAQLIHSQKMEAIGTLAGGIAHDFNNMLMGIQGYLSLMRLNPDANEEYNKYVKGIEENVMSAANLTDQLLGFARKGKYRLSILRLNDLVEKSLRMFTRTKKEIKVHKHCQKDIWNTKADRGQIEQVLINLYLNAWQAMPEGGDLYIQTENLYLSDDYCKPFEVTGGNYVKVSVTDTGIGMDQETTERVFEPFFTTKDMGKGTGLGLASAYGIIKNHNGIIRVYSEVGHGATFSIYLPAVMDAVKEEPQVASELVTGSETILLVDDEDSPLKVEELMLKELGYKVLTAKSGREAVRIFKDNPDEVDMIALDIIMPEMSGRATYLELRKIDADVKVLLVSGYSLNKQIEELLNLGCIDFIQKPFDINQLSEKMRLVLDAESEEEQSSQPSGMEQGE